MMKISLRTNSKPNSDFPNSNPRTKNKLNPNQAEKPKHTKSKNSNSAFTLIVKMDYRTAKNMARKDGVGSFATAS